MTVTRKYKVYHLYLVGDDSGDYLNYKDYDLSRTDVRSTHIDGYAGKNYTINAEFRAKDRLRWNYKSSTNLFIFKNFYGLDG